MIVNKITIGFVIQQFDTETSQCISQEFVSGDEVSYESENGELLDENEFDGLFLYQSYDMVEPTNE